MGVQLFNPFNLLVVEQQQQEAPRQASSEKKDKQKKHKPRRCRGQNQEKASSSESVSSVSSVTSPSDIAHQINERKIEEVIEACDDNEGWKIVKHATRNKNGSWNSSQPQIEKKQLAILKDRVFEVEEVIKQLMEAATGVDANPRKPNMNGSARRRLQKKKAVAAPESNETAPSENMEKKFVVTYTLKEFEERKKNGDGIKSEEKHYMDEGKKGMNGFHGRQKEKVGKRSNGDIEDVLDVIQEKGEETSFTLDFSEFPSLGKALRI